MEYFFISGCQRSGTTLLRLLLETHPAVKCFDEALGYPILIKKVKDGILNYHIKKDVCRLVFKIPRFTEQLLRSEYDDIDYGRFPGFYNGEKLIHIVRDVRDVVTSMITLEVPGGSSWYSAYGRPILEKQLQHPLVAERFGKKFREIKNKGCPAHLICALYWSIKNQGLLDLIEAKAPVHALRYESLVSKPKQVLLKICKFIDLPWNDLMMTHQSQDHDELDENGLAIGNTNPLRPIDTKSIGRYSVVLSDKEVDEIDIITSDVSKKIDTIL